MKTEAWVPLVWGFSGVLFFLSSSNSVSHSVLIISDSWPQHPSQLEAVDLLTSLRRSPRRPDMKLQTQENLRLQNEIRKLEAILPAVDSSQKENVDVVSFDFDPSKNTVSHTKLTSRMRF